MAPRDEPRMWLPPKESPSCYSPDPREVNVDYRRREAFRRLLETHLPL